MERVKYQPYKVRRVPGRKMLYQVCKYGLIDGMEIMPGYFDTVKMAQEFADAMNLMIKGAVLHV